MAQLNYTIKGNDLQYIEIALDSGQEAVAEQGAMMYVDRNVAINAILGDGSASRLGGLGRLWNAVKRSFTGESLFSSIYKNTSHQTQIVAISAPGPGEIVPINLSEHGGSIVCQKGAYLAGELGQKTQVSFPEEVTRRVFLVVKALSCKKSVGKARYLSMLQARLKKLP